VIGGHRVVFTTGLRIRALDTRSFAISALGHAAAFPFGLSVSGGRVAWVENLSGYARIRALTLSG
jgi:hypothetical protein